MVEDDEIKDLKVDSKCVYEIEEVGNLAPRFEVLSP